MWHIAWLQRKKCSININESTVNCHCFLQPFILHEQHCPTQPVGLAAFPHLSSSQFLAFDFLSASVIHLWNVCLPNIKALVPGNRERLITINNPQTKPASGRRPWCYTHHPGCSARTKKTKIENRGSRKDRERPLLNQAMLCRSPGLTQLRSPAQEILGPNGAFAS